MRAHSFGPGLLGPSLYRARKPRAGRRQKMSALTVSVVAGIIGGLGLLAKMVVMAIQGGPEPATSVPENIAFFVGIIGVSVAWTAAGVGLMRGRSVPWRIGAGVVGFLALAVLLGGGQLLLSALPGAGWWQEEAIFGLLGLLTLVAALVLGLRHRPTSDHGPR